LNRLAHGEEYLFRSSSRFGRIDDRSRWRREADALTDDDIISIKRASRCVKLDAGWSSLPSPGTVGAMNHEVDSAWHNVREAQQIQGAFV